MYSALPTGFAAQRHAQCYKSTRTVEKKSTNVIRTVAAVIRTVAAEKSLAGFSPPAVR